MIINKAAKIIFLLITLIVFISCSSSSDSTSASGKNRVNQNNSETGDSRKGKAVHVDFLDKDEIRRRGGSPESRTFEKALINTAFATKQKWFRMQENYKDYKKYSDKSVAQLRREISGADAAKTTLIIEVLSRKGPTAVSTIVKSLKDSRAVKFKNDDVMYWYEEKNKPPQDMEIRIYAAMHLEKMLAVFPYGVMFNIHKVRTDKGPVEVLYALKGSYAVTKEDVCENWLKWWSVYGGDYK